MKSALVILAAGASRRLGTCKAGVRLGERSALAQLLRAGAPCFDDPPRIICGPSSSRLRGTPGHAGHWIYNPHWNLGRSSGLTLVQRLLPGRDLCVAPVDCPLVPRAVFEALIQRWSELGRPARGWLAPHYRGEQDLGEALSHGYGHPILMGRQLAAELHNLPPDAPLRELRSRAEPLTGVSVPHPEVLFDLDTPEDLVQLRTFLERLEPKDIREPGSLAQL